MLKLTNNLKLLPNVNQLSAALLKVFNNKLSTDLNSVTSATVKVSSEDKYVTVEELQPTAAIPLKYSKIWLRDNCQCEQCFDRLSKSRAIDWNSFNLEGKVEKLWFDDNKSELNIKWDDEHHSVHPLDWLKERRFDEPARLEYLEKFYRPKKKLWTKDQFEQVMETFEYKDVMKNNETLKAWIQCLAVNGVAMIKNTPTKINEIKHLCNRIGFIRKTHFGEEYEIFAKEDANNRAYLSTPLQFHTDLPYYEYKPGVTVLHCLIQTTSPGAFSLLADGFYVAEHMRKNYPEMFAILTQTLVNWNDVNVETDDVFHKIYRAPVIRLDREGNYERINHSVPQRDSYFSIPLEQVDDWYRASAKFIELCYKEASYFKMSPGNLLAFDNIRLVHGRTGYTDNSNNVRHLIGAYLDWDEVFSRLRVLK